MQHRQVTDWLSVELVLRWLGGERGEGSLDKTQEVIFVPRTERI